MATVNAIAAPVTPHDRWLPLARALWFVVLALVVGLTLFNIPFQWAHSQIVCSGAACPSDQIAPGDAAQLQRAGLSVAFFAGWLIAQNVIFVLVFSIIGGLIFWPRPGRESNNWFGIFVAFALPLTGFALTGGGTPPPAIVEHIPALLLPIRLLSMLGLVGLFTFFYLFPDGHFVPHWTVWLVPLVILHEALLVFRPEVLGQDWYSLLEVLTVLFAPIYRYWRVSNAIQRQQTKWVIFGSALAGVGSMGLTAFGNLVPGATVGVVDNMIFNSAWSLFMLLIPLSIGVAILRTHLWDIDILIRRTLIYGVLTALLALVYLGAVVSLQALFTAITGQQRSELVTVLSTLAIAALFVPLRGRIQSVIDRRFYRRKYDAARTLAQFGTALRDEVNLDELSAHLLDAVDESMQPESVALWLVKR